MDEQDKQDFNKGEGVFQPPIFGNGGQECPPSFLICENLRHLWLIHSPSELFPLITDNF